MYNEFLLPVAKCVGPRVISDAVSTIFGSNSRSVVYTLPQAERVGLWLSSSFQLMGLDVKLAFTAFS